MLKIAILLGGPSSERAISLNSARSVADHIEGNGVAIHALIYFDTRARPYRISRSLLYSNTPDDFDFKLGQPPEPDDPDPSTPLSQDGFADLLGECDLAFPVMHGRFGEDGQVQKILDDLGIPYVGSPASACAVAYDKFLSYRRLIDIGVPTVPTVLFRPEEDQTGKCPEEKFVERAAAEFARVAGELSWFEAVSESPAVVLKPSAGGSSIGVEVVKRIDTDLLSGAAVGAAAAHLYAAHGQLVMQPFVVGTEVTTVVLEGPDGPVALVPVEVELVDRDDDVPVLTFENKYFPSDDTHYHCPPRPPVAGAGGLSDATIDEIRRVSERVFTEMGLRDFARIDCRVTPENEVLVCDLNVISGMEQNSFIFIQAAQVGMVHTDVLHLVLTSACRRTGLEPPAIDAEDVETDGSRRVIPVLFGGPTAEKDVSVLSGTNVWLKLLASSKYKPKPYLLEGELFEGGRIWELTYPVALRHSAHQVAAACASAARDEPRRARLAEDIVRRLDLQPPQLSIDSTLPRQHATSAFLDDASFVFIALHGGAGEDGRLQRELDRRNIAYNGCGPDASALCMDKYETGRFIANLQLDGVTTARRTRIDIPAPHEREDLKPLWASIQEECQTEKVMVKPLADGCSAGVAPLVDAGELGAYIEAISSGRKEIGSGQFTGLGADQTVKLPTTETRQLLFEAFIDSDDVSVVNGASPGDQPSETSDEGHPAILRWLRSTGLIEVTVGVVGVEGGMRALSPSVTIARSGVLSVHEKFMGGTGVNITPPPAPSLGPVTPEVTARAKDLIGQVATALGIRGYARLDAFLDYTTGDVLIIEANTLPGLTPATVLYHQALAEASPRFPREFLEHLIDLGIDAQEANALN